MLISNEQHVTDEDLTRYFGGCYVLDPITGRPSKIEGITSRIVTVRAAGEARWGATVAHTGDNALPFANLGTYAVPTLGWRRVGNRVSYVTRSAAAGGGVRGLAPNRIGSYGIGHITGLNMECVDALAISRGDPPMCLAVFSPHDSSLKQEIAAAAAENWQLPRVINSRILLLPVLVPTPDIRYLLVCERFVVGHGNENSFSVIDPVYIDYLGDINGLAVR